MIIVRPIKKSDLKALHQIAIDSGHGFTSLPVNEQLLQQRISLAEESFSKEVSQAGSEGYLFVMEDTETGDVVGTSGIEAAVGLDDAFYHYHLGKVVHSSRELNIYNTVETLSLCNDYTGASEICTLFLSDSHRKNNNGRFLSRFRFLFIAEHKERFSDTIIAEMRGVSDNEGRSPFWNWLEEHFFSMDFPTADYLISQTPFWSLECVPRPRARSRRVDSRRDRIPARKFPGSPRNRDERRKEAGPRVRNP